MENQRDYYQLYLKYKKKYLALKTGGAIIYEKEISKNGKIVKEQYIKTKIGEMNLSGINFPNAAIECYKKKYKLTIT